MKRAGVGAAIVALGLSTLAPARAVQAVTGVSSDNVSYVSTVPFEAGGAWGAEFVGRYMYVAGYRSFSIYDVSDPIAPALVSVTPIVGNGLTGEDVDTNGEILVLTAQTPVKNALQVYDVEDKSAPKLIAELEGAGDHTVTCVLDCRYAFGSNPDMTVVDLRDPSRPRLIGSWGRRYGPGFTHDVTEVAPGRVMTSSKIMLFLDARKDPARPTLLAHGYPDSAPVSPIQQSFNGSNLWPRSARDRFMLVNGESPISGQCSENSASFSTWDMTKWKRTRSFTPIDDYRVANGTYTDGNPSANALGCSPLWFGYHPRFRNGGLVAASFAEHGVRFLQVNRTGRINEVGYFTPYGGSTTAAYWVGDEIVYAIDFNRGIDILRLHSD